ncbi:hypothetical protein RclHR1_25900001 [Rhizophagus clarus]|uniref:DDE-1 domain-containing protein n=1 Tax=Rhizophagus clarus TaxID=94130 RepID=A0A2Z6RCI3_9GLOM|nr:hypothetical protein RclHR1_25900001 [Rhizophagus clarus]
MKPLVWFDMAGNMTVNNKGDKTVHIRITENDKNHFTIVLTCLTDGTKYPPICIFKGFEYQKIYQKRLPMIVYDSFRGHLAKSVKIKFKQHNFHLVIIPAGLTSICQPLDVSINKPFKDNLRKEWHEWISRGDSGITVAGNLKRARISDVCGWIKRSWDAVSDQIIFNSFKKCSISNLLDGSEDDMVYEEIDKLIAEYEKENLEEFGSVKHLPISGRPLILSLTKYQYLGCLLKNDNTTTLALITTKLNNLYLNLNALNHIQDDWSHTIFSDESTFQTFHNTQIMHYKAGNLRPSHPMVKHPYKVHVWGAFSHQGPIGVALFTGK